MNIRSFSTAVAISMAIGQPIYASEISYIAIGDGQQSREVLPPITLDTSDSVLPAEGRAKPKPRTLCGGECALTFEVAPNATRSRPFDEQNYADALTLSGELELTHIIRQGQHYNPLDITATLGPSLVLDSDDGGTNTSTSSFSTALTVNYRPIRPITLSASYGVEASFERQFRDDAGSQQTWTGRITWDLCKSCLRILRDTNIAFSILRTDASDPTSDTTTYRVRANLRVEAGPIDFFANAEANRRIYDRAVLGTERRDWEYFVMGGVDLTRAMQGIFPRLSNLHRLRVGYRYTEIDSTVAAFDKATRAILPVIAFQTTF